MADNFIFLADVQKNPQKTSTDSTYAVLEAPLNCIQFNSLVQILNITYFNYVPYFTCYLKMKLY